MKDLDKTDAHALTVEEELTTISPVTMLFLKTKWGVARLKGLVDAKTEFAKSLSQYKEAQARLNNTEETVAQTLAVEKKQREQTYATCERQIAKERQETELLGHEKELRIYQLQAEIARLKAESAEHEQRMRRAASREPRQPREETSRATQKTGYDTAWDHLEIQRELHKMRKEVDACVAAGELSEEEGARIKEEMEDMIFAEKVKGKKK